MTKQRPSRRRSIARASAWCGIVLASVLTVAWVGSRWWSVLVFSPHGHALLADGEVFGLARSDRPGDSWEWITSKIDKKHSRHFGWFQSLSLRPGQTHFWIPLWPFILAFGIPSTWILLATRRPRDPFACPHCRYPRGVGRGASPICPECGQPLPNLPHSH